MLSSYTSRGILTLNEARAALGRPPLGNAAADTPMALTGQGYVAVGAGTPPEEVGKGANWDESKHPRWGAGASDHQGGRFSSADTAPSQGRQKLAFTGTLIDKRYDEVIGITHCTYSTPVKTFTVEHKGYYSCDEFYPAPRF